MKTTPYSRTTLFRLALAAGLVLLLFAAAPAFDELVRNPTYDRYFERYAARYFGAGFDWRIFKAQAIAESRLDPGAVSAHGAVGLMQLLPATFRQVAEEHPEIRGDIRHPRWNIAAGIRYDRRLWELWDAGRPRADRLRFMLGSYNAGYETILDAQQVAMERGLDPHLWASIEECLDAVAPADHGETLHYVETVFRVRRRMADMRIAERGR